MFTYVYTHVYTHVNIWLHIGLNTCLHICFAHMLTHRFSHMVTHRFKHMFTDMFCTHAYTQVFTHVLMTILPTSSIFLYFHSLSDDQKGIPEPKGLVSPQVQGQVHAMRSKPCGYPNTPCTYIEDTICFQTTKLYFISLFDTIAKSMYSSIF